MKPSLFTSMLVKDGVIPLFNVHAERLKNDCARFNLPCEITPQVLREFAAQHSAQQGTWRMRIIVHPDTPQEYTLDPLPEPAPKALSLVTYPHPLDFTFAPFKRWGCPNRSAIQTFLQQSGSDDVLKIHPDHTLLETAVANIIWSSKGIFYTSDPSLPLYFGVTLSLLKQVRPSRISMAQLPSDCKIFTINALRKVSPVRAVDEREFLADWEAAEYLNRELVQNSLIQNSFLLYS